MHGDLSNKLVQQARRLQSLPTLPPYATELVRAITREVIDLDRDATHTLANYPGGSQNFSPSEDQATACALLVDHLSNEAEQEVFTCLP